METRNQINRRFSKEKRRLEKIRQESNSQLRTLNTMILMIMIILVLTIIGWVVWNNAPSPDPTWKKINFCQEHPNNPRCF